MRYQNGKQLNSQEPISPTQRIQVIKTKSNTSVSDNVVGEEPLEIRIDGGAGLQQLAITMRTPGADIELGAGFLWTEGLLRSRDDLIGITTCKDKELSPREQENVIVARVVADAPAVTRTLERRFTISSACGICGSTQIDDLRKRGYSNVVAPGISESKLLKLPELMRPKQKIFDKTGGLHAAGLFDPSGKLLVVREDVGRHNAVDKVIGYALMSDLLPLDGFSLAISGRGGFEIIQKAIAARISAVVAVSAPTSLAVETAREFGLSLYGFTRDGAATKYSPI